MHKKLLSKAKNVEFLGVKNIEEVGADLSTFILIEPTPSEWNFKAKKKNTLLFVEIHERQPKNYEEVLQWAYSVGLKHKENQIAGNDLAFI